MFQQTIRHMFFEHAAVAEHHEQRSCVSRGSDQESNCRIVLIAFEYFRGTPFDSNAFQILVFIQLVFRRCFEPPSDPPGFRRHNTCWRKIKHNISKTRLLRVWMDFC